MTAPEESIYYWLGKNKIKFNFQSQLTGGFSNKLGDEKANFELPDPNIILRVQGTNIHKTSLSANDVIHKERLTGQGYTVVDLWDSDIKESLDLVMIEAIKGREI